MTDKVSTYIFNINHVYVQICNFFNIILLQIINDVCRLYLSPSIGKECAGLSISNWKDGGYKDESSKRSQKASTLSPPSPSSWLAFTNLFSIILSIFTSRPPSRIVEHLEKTISGAPFITTRNLEPLSILWTDA